MPHPKPARRPPPSGMVARESSLAPRVLAYLQRHLGGRYTAHMVADALGERDKIDHVQMSLVLLCERRQVRQDKHGWFIARAGA
jgi:hypothetical protein